MLGLHDNKILFLVGQKGLAIHLTSLPQKDDLGVGTLEQRQKKLALVRDNLAVTAYKV